MHAVPLKPKILKFCSNLDSDILRLDGYFTSWVDRHLTMATTEGCTAPSEEHDRLNNAPLHCFATGARRITASEDHSKASLACVLYRRPTRKLIYMTETHRPGMIHNGNRRVQSGFASRCSKASLEGALA